MDDYTRKTVELLLSRNKAYLVEILKSQNILVNESDELTTEKVCSLISIRNEDKDSQLESSIYKCSCGSRLVTVREVQLRSADEGSSIVRSCRACGRKW